MKPLKLILFLTLLMPLAAFADVPFYTRSDRLLWSPDITEFPALQVQVPEVAYCNENGSSCFDMEGWWFGTNYSDKTSVQVEISGSFVDFDGVQLADNYGNSLILSDGMKLLMHIDANTDEYLNTGVAFKFLDPGTTNIEQGGGYYIEYSSDGDAELEMVWPLDDYGYNTYKYTLPAGENSLNIPWSDFSQDVGWGEQPQDISYRQATQLKIRIATGTSDPAKDVNFKLKKLGWVQINIPDGFLARNDKLLWSPDTDKFPSLQVQVPEVVSCKGVYGTLPCFDATDGWWWAMDFDEHKSTSIYINGAWTTFTSGLSLTDGLGNSKIPSTGMQLRMSIDGGDFSYVAGVGFNFLQSKGPTNIQIGGGYSIEYTSDGDAELEMGWPNEYGYDTYKYTLPAGTHTLNIPWEDFSKNGYAGLPTTIGTAINNATKLQIRIANETDDPGPGKIVNFTLKKLGWYGALQPSPQITYYYVPDGTVGEYYTDGYVISDQVVTWSTEGNLPPGLTLWSDGTISGTPTTVGTYTFTVKATNSNGSASKTFTISIQSPPAPVIIAEEPDRLNGVVGEYGRWTFLEEGQQNGIAWEVVDSPDWVESTGANEYEYTLYGTPTKAGDYTFQIKATNSVNISSTETFTITVIKPNKPVITTTDLPNGTRGEPYEYNNVYLTAKTAYAKWSATKEKDLPPGLYIDANNGYIGGVPTKTGKYTFEVKAENVSGKDTKKLSITIGAEQNAPIISDWYIPNTGNEGEDYWGRVSSNRFANWSMEGDVPPGLYISNDYYSGAEISGTPTSAGFYTFTIRATNSVGSDSRSYTVYIDEPPPPPQIATNTLPNGTVNIYYQKQLELNTSIVNWDLISGNLPSGLWINNDGYIAGMPRTAGTYTFQIEARNSSGRDTKEFTININQKLQVPEITTNLPDGTEYESYSALLEATEFVDTWSVISGSLPTGINLYPGDYEIYGYPSPGVYTFTIAAVNDAGYGTKEFTITIRTLAESLCIENGDVWDGSGCVSKEAVCAANGGVFYNGSCLAPQQATCMMAGRVWENGNCRDKNPQEIAKDNCIAAGNRWESNECKISPIRPPQIAIGNILLNTTGNAITLSNLPLNTKVDVYNLQGKQVYSNNSGNSQLLKILVTKGMYIVKVGTQTLRAVVR